MRHGAVKSHENPVLERGDIYFLDRPRIEANVVHRLRDVERLFILLTPARRHLYRLVVVGRKKLPDPQEHTRFWAFVWRVFQDGEARNRELGEKDYDTKTRGARHVLPVRSAAEGIYALVGENSQPSMRRSSCITKGPNGC